MQLSELNAHRHTAATRSGEISYIDLGAGPVALLMPQLRELTVPTLVVWGTGDAFFDVSWAYWLRDTIPGTTRVVTVDGARLFFPEERPMDLVPHLEQHWAAVAAAGACAPEVPSRARRAGSRLTGAAPG